MSIVIGKASLSQKQMDNSWNALQKAFQYCLEKSKIQNSKLPGRIMQELQHKTLFLAESEISEEEIPLICQFLKRPESLRYIETLVIAQNSTVGKAHNRKCTHFKAGKLTALYADNCRLFRTVVAFIAKSSNLNRIIIESVQINIHMLTKLSDALAVTKSSLSSFGIKSSPIGDEGFGILAPSLGKLAVQIVALENCDLTDDSCKYIAKLIKAQEDRMDTAYWNATLRAGISDFNISPDTVHVLWSGMIALSLSGNRISGSSFALVGNVLRKNFWFLGINLANNMMTTDEIKSFLISLASNTTIHAITLGGNPGFTHELATLSTDIISRNESRLHRLPSSLEANLRRWIDMQLADARYSNFIVDNPRAGDISNISDPTMTHMIEEQQNESGLSAYMMPFLDIDDDFHLINEVDPANNIDIDHATPTPSDMLQHHLNGVDNLMSRLASNQSSLDSSPREGGIDGRPPSRISMRPRNVMHIDNHDQVINTHAHGSSVHRASDLYGSVKQPTISQHLDYEPNIRPSSAKSSKFSPNRLASTAQAIPIARSSILPRDRPSSAPPRSSTPAAGRSSITSHSRRSMSPYLTSSSQNKKFTAKITTARKSEYHPRKSPMLAVFGKSISSPSRPQGTYETIGKPSQKPNEVMPAKMMKKKKKRRSSVSKSSSSGRKPSYLDNIEGTTEYFEQLSDAVLQATTNLANVSLQLRDVASSLSDTLSQHSQLIQSQIQESMLAKHSPSAMMQPGPSKFFSPFSASASHEKMHMPSEMKSSPERTPGMTRSPNQLRQTVASSRDEDKQAVKQSIVDEIIDGEMTGQDVSNLRDSFSKMSDNDTITEASMDDEELANMIRSVMRQKLTSLLSTEV